MLSQYLATPLCPSFCDTIKISESAHFASPKYLYFECELNCVDKCSSGLYVEYVRNWGIVGRGEIA